MLERSLIEDDSSISVEAKHDEKEEMPALRVAQKLKPYWMKCLKRYFRKSWRENCARIYETL